MDLTNIKTENGFITQGELLRRFHKVRPMGREHYHMRKIVSSDFAEVGLMDDRFAPAMVKLFKIYVGTQELYEYMKVLIESTAQALTHKAKVENWRSNES